MRNPQRRPNRQATNARTALVIAAIFSGAGSAIHALAQSTEPAFTADSPVAESTIASVPSLLARGGAPEAARAIQNVLNAPRGKVARVREGDDLWTDVRTLANRVLLDHPDLLRVYAEQEETRAHQMLASGLHHEVERTRLLTPSGFEACLRVAQLRFESGDFDGAAITLQQLDEHPTRTDKASGADASKLAAQIARYTPRADLKQLAQRWAQDAGITLKDAPPVPIPEALRRQIISPLAGAPDAHTGETVPRPLSSVPLPLTEAMTETQPVLSPGSPLGTRTEEGASWTFPVVAGHLLLINDGAGITCLDRYTLRTNWSHRYEGSPDERLTTDDLIRPVRRRTSEFDDVCTVAVRANTVVACAGIPMGNTRAGDPNVYAFDLTTGERLWSVNPADADESLLGGATRGPAIIEGETVIVAVRQASGMRRLTTLALVGLDLATGETRWVTPVGSIGSIPYQNTGSTSSAMIAHDGIVYRSDELGMLCAVEASTGRTRWVRRFAPRSTSIYNPDPAFTIDTPVLIGDELVTLTPDHGTLIRLDARTGEVRATIDTRALTTTRPSYLVSTADTIAVVATNQITLVPIPPAPDAQTTPVRLGADNPITGRVVSTGGRFAIPTAKGIAFTDPRIPDSLTVQELDVTGNAILADGQILVADHTSVHSLLDWARARDLLRDRIKASNNDPEPAITFAELAFRAGQHAEILDAIGTARRKLEGSPHPGVARDRLFRVTMSMLTPSLSTGLNTGPRENAKGNELTEPITDNALLRALVDHAEQLASGPTQRVIALLARGGFEERVSSPALAIEAYQTILATDKLAGTLWTGNRLAVTAEVEATRRIRNLLQTNRSEGKPDLYDPYDAKARAMLNEAGQGDAAALERSARAYPFARSAPDAWLRTARAQLETSSEHASIRSLRSGLDTADTIARLRGVESPKTRGELAGSLLHALVTSGRDHEAADILAGLSPALALTHDAQPLDRDAIAREITKSIAEGPRPARVGIPSLTSLTPALFRGHLLEPLATPERTDDDPQLNAPDGALLLDPVSASLSWLEPDADRGARKRWTVPVRAEPVLLQRGESSAWLLYPDDQGGIIERVALSNGETMWRSSPWPLLVGDIPQEDAPWEAPRGLAPIPNEGRLPVSQLLVAPTRNTITLADRLGRMVTLDASSGVRLWKAALPLARVYDIDVLDGVIAVAGPSDKSPNPDANLDGKALILEVRTGAELGTVSGPRFSPTWLRLVDNATLIVGNELSCMSIRIPQGEPIWTAEGPSFEATRGARVVGSMIWVTDESDTTWPLEPGSGRKGESPIAGADLNRRLGWTRITRVGDHVSVATPDGINIVDSSGSPITVGALATPGALLPPVFAGDMLITLESAPRRVAQEGIRRQLHFLDARSARLIRSLDVQLFAMPRAVGAIDNAVLIDAGDVVMVIPAPADAPKENTARGSGPDSIRN